MNLELPFLKSRILLFMKDTLRILAESSMIIASRNSIVLSITKGTGTILNT